MKDRETNGPTLADRLQTATDHQGQSCDQLNRKNATFFNEEADYVGKVFGTLSAGQLQQKSFRQGFVESASTGQFFDRIGHTDAVQLLREAHEVLTDLVSCLT